MNSGKSFFCTISRNMDTAVINLSLSLKRVEREKRSVFLNVSSWAIRGGIALKQNYNGNLDKLLYFFNTAFL